MNESQVPVAANLPAGYLNCQEGASKVECILGLLLLRVQVQPFLFYCSFSSNLIFVQTIKFVDVLEMPSQKLQTTI